MIFYADDDLDDLMVFEDIAKELGVELMTFDSGIKMVERLSTPPPSPSVIFLDINMPLYNGIEILSIIRDQEGWKNIPVVMFTTSNDATHIQDSLDAGATYYIKKDNDYKELLKSIRYVIDREWKGFHPNAGNFVYPSK